jgi:hypothetical protein
LTKLYDQSERTTFGLLPGWRDVLAMSSSYQSAVVIGRPFLNLDFVILKFSSLTKFRSWADGSQKPTRQQAVDVVCNFCGCFPSTIRMKYYGFVYSIFLSVTVVGCSSTTTTSKPDVEKASLSFKADLKHPFGTLLKIEVEVFDGDLTARKEYEGVYLFKIKTIENKQPADTLLMRFRDDTGKFPTNDFELHKYLFGRDTGSISSDQVDKMKKEYAGKVFNIVAYESGEFAGFPKGYFEYQEEKAGMDFHFQNYLVVVADLTKPIK